MAFTPEFIAKVRDASDIVGVIQAWVPLRKSGSSYMGLCPFHQERTPSFSVVPSKQIFHCFGCGEGGDVFAFVQKREKVDFVAALKLLAERAGLEPTEEEADPEARAQAQRRRAEEEAQRRILDLAEAWFRRNLEEGAEGARALEYAVSRGLDEGARERFRLGYAPADPGALLAAASKGGHRPEALVAAGLAVRGERGVYSRFRGRLMFPIRDARGRLAGFGGRLLGPGEPKYLNSPEGPLFSKGRLLYPWDRAKDALGKTREAVVCEGYMDAIACHQASLEGAVATLGTALTEEHARLLKRYVERVVVVFDADEAGLRAARRAAEPLLKAALEVRVARLDGAKDPDELLRRAGAGALRDAVASARPLVGFCVEAALAAAGPDPAPAARAAALREAFPLLRLMPSSSEADATLEDAARSVGVSAEAARGDFAAFRSGADPRSARTQGNAPASPSPRPSGALERVERELLALLVGRPALVGTARSELDGATLSTPELRAAAELLWRAPGGAVLLLEDDGSETFKAGDALLRDLNQSRVPQFAPPEEILRDLLSRRQELLLEREAESRGLALRQTAGDPAAAARLLAELQAFKRAIEDLRSERRRQSEE